jgi:imidazolonepropionase-like amidohydrolase
MPMAIAKAAVAAAHKAGKPVFAHPSSDSGILIAVESGVDVLTHTEPFDGFEWGPSTLQRMLTHKTALTPTLKLWTLELGRAHLSSKDSTAIMARALRQLGAYSRAGGDVLFGTDVGYVPDYSPLMEYRLMSDAGMSFAEILTSLTTAPARRFGKTGETGRIEPGAVADLVLLAGDPAKDSRAFGDVRYTIRKGAIIYARKVD